VGCRVRGYLVWAAGFVVILCGLQGSWLSCVGCRVHGYLVWAVGFVVILCGLQGSWLSCVGCRVRDYLVWAAGFAVSKICKWRRKQRGKGVGVQGIT